ncbi:hypothetical protein RCH18_002459 [Flavobacterium sp. PL11]|uniref:hypothetical protein n=1 Tax=Flavobacterium sp. PL11 TaxID=3071717 RepID=UPI002DFECA25|nr:hypothetical protein [Flavobacterium sp. PL11]
MEKENGNYGQRGFFTWNDSKSTARYYRGRKGKQTTQRNCNIKRNRRKIERRIAKKEISLGEKKKLQEVTFFKTWKEK